MLSPHRNEDTRHVTSADDMMRLGESPVSISWETQCPVAGTISPRDAKTRPVSSKRSPEIFRQVNALYKEADGIDQLENAAKKYNLVSEELVRVETQRNIISMFFIEETNEETRLRFMRLSQRKALAHLEKTGKFTSPTKSTCIESTCQELTTPNSCDVVQEIHTFIAAEVMAALHRDLQLHFLWDIVLGK